MLVLLGDTLAVRPYDVVSVQSVGPEREQYRSLLMLEGGRIFDCTLTVAEVLEKLKDALAPPPVCGPSECAPQANVPDAGWGCSGGVITDFNGNPVPETSPADSGCGSVTCKPVADAVVSSGDYELDALTEQIVKYCGCLAGSGGNPFGGYCDKCALTVAKNAQYLLIRLAVQSDGNWGDAADAWSRTYEARASICRNARNKYRKGRGSK